VTAEELEKNPEGQLEHALDSQYFPMAQSVQADEPVVDTVPEEHSTQAELLPEASLR
jgi:hypothetical protein